MLPVLPCVFHVTCGWHASHKRPPSNSLRGCSGVDKNTGVLSPRCLPTVSQPSPPASPNDQHQQTRIWLRSGDMQAHVRNVSSGEGPMQNSIASRSLALRWANAPLDCAFLLRMHCPKDHPPGVVPAPQESSRTQMESRFLDSTLSSVACSDPLLLTRLTRLPRMASSLRHSRHLTSTSFMPAPSPGQRVYRDLHQPGSLLTLGLR